MKSHCIAVVLVGSFHTLQRGAKSFVCVRAHGVAFLSPIGGSGGHT